MDAIGVIEKVLGFRWDAPYRIVASILAIAGVVGLFSTHSGLLVISAVVDWFGWGNGASALAATHDWVAARGDVFIAAGILLTCAGILFAHRGGRGGATAMLGVALCAEIANFAPLIIVGAALVIGIVLRVITDRLFADDPITEAVIVTPLALLGALFYLIGAPAAWALLRD